MKLLHISLLLELFIFPVYSQVGIGTISPNPSSQLEVQSNNKGILFPKIMLNSVIDTSLDGVNTAATGLIIYNKNASVSGGDGVGYYYFNGTIWEKIAVTGSVQDADWYIENSTLIPTNINDNIYTLGKIGINKNTPSATLDIESTAERVVNINLSNGSINPKYLCFLTSSYSGSGELYGSYFQFIDTPGIISSATGIYNQLNSVSNTLLSRTGLYNKIDGSGTGDYYGVYNDISILNKTGRGIVDLMGNLTSGDIEVYGNSNVIDVSGDGNHYGTYNLISGNGTGTKYGVYGTINSSLGGSQHYGIYSKVLSISGFSGYFLGRFRIEDNSVNYYILPETRGDANQIMLTNASGITTWQDYPNHRINDIIDAKSDFDGSENGSSIFLGINAGINDDETDNRSIGVGFEALKTQNDSNAILNTAVGYQAQSNISKGINNTSFGFKALKGIGVDNSDNTAIGASSMETIGSGLGNSAVGYKSAFNITSGNNNVAIGTQSLYFITSGGGNVASGYKALYSLNGTNFNVAIGYKSLYFNKGNYNIAIGKEAGYMNINGNNNIFIGKQAGYFEMGSNKLYIENSDSSQPLIYGEFDTDTLIINGNFASGTYSSNPVPPSGNFEINRILRLEPRTSYPVNPAEGDLFVNNTDNHIYCYLNGAWKQLDN